MDALIIDIKTFSSENFPSLEQISRIKKIVETNLKITKNNLKILKEHQDVIRFFESMMEKKRKFSN